MRRVREQLSISLLNAPFVLPNEADDVADDNVDNVDDDNDAVSGVGLVERAPLAANDSVGEELVNQSINESVAMSE